MTPFSFRDSYQNLDIKDKSILELFEVLNAYQKAIDVNIISSITDKNGVIIHANDKFCYVSQYTREEILGKSHNIINSGYHSKTFFKELWQTISKGGVWNKEIKNKAKDGTFYWVDSVILPVLNADNEIQYYLSLRLLITEKKNAEAIEQTENIKKLNEVLQMTSHFVRGPIATSLGLINILEKDKEIEINELKQILNHLRTNIINLDIYTKDLTKFVYEWEVNYKAKNS